MTAKRDLKQPPAPELTEPAEGFGALLRAALPSVPGLGLLPGVRKQPAADFAGLAMRRPGVVIDGEHVQAYRRVCGFETKDAVPPTYPHLLGFGLQLAIMADPRFPEPAIGTVHIANTIRTTRRLTVGEAVEVTVRVDPGRPHPKGRVYDFTTEIRPAGAVETDEPVWVGVSTYLRRGAAGGDSARDDDPAVEKTPDALADAQLAAQLGAQLHLADTPPTGIVWSLPADLGRRYAAVAGDRNPIHLYRASAMALGFPRQIAHGMWSLARCVATLENRLAPATWIAAEFKKPILLPGKVAFGSAPVEDGYRFSLHSLGSGAPHLIGLAENH